MGRVGRWIDSLPVDGVERDAIITHPDPTFDGSSWWSSARGCGCLVGCVMDLKFTVHTSDAVENWERAMPYFAWKEGAVSRDEFLAADEAGQRFFDLCENFGAERMWRVVKLRAARNHAPPLTPSPSVERERAQA